MMNDYVLTIDVDWASDFFISEVANILIENDIKATWFITHDSQEIRKLSKYPDLFEVGIHPNFQQGSTQGKNPKDVIMYLIRIVPYAKSIRTHGLVQSSQLLRIIREDFDIYHDVSLFLPETPNIMPHKIYFSKTSKCLSRFPFFWEDDMEMHRPEPCFSFKHKKYQVSGLKIFNFHPVHIVLNSYDMTNYSNFKNYKNSNELSAESLQSYINKGQGTGKFFREVVKFLSDNAESPTYTISDLAQKWNEISGFE